MPFGAGRGDAAARAPAGGVNGMTTPLRLTPTVALLSVHAVLLLWMGGRAAMGDLSLPRPDPAPAPPEAPPVAGASAGPPADAQGTDPIDFLPLAGMPGGPTAAAEACARLAGFLGAVDAQLRAAGGLPPPVATPAETREASPPCSVTAPRVAAQLAAYGVALNVAGLPPVGPIPGPAFTRGGGAHRSLRVERRAPD